MLALVFLVTLIAFIVFWWKKRKARKQFGKDSEQYKRTSKIKRVIGIVCIVSLIATIATAPEPKQKANAPVQQKQTEQSSNSAKEQPKEEKPAPAKEQPKEKHVYDQAKVVDMMNGTKTKAIGKVSVIEIDSSKVTQQALEDWYFNYAKKHLDNNAEEKYNYCIIAYTDKGGKLGVHAMSGIVTKDTPLTKDKDGTYSIEQSGGETLVPTEDGHLKKLKK